jgi:hypothetical protein
VELVAGVDGFALVEVVAGVMGEAGGVCCAVDALLGVVVDAAGADAESSCLPHADRASTETITRPTVATLFMGAFLWWLECERGDAAFHSYVPRRSHDTALALEPY